VSSKRIDIVAWMALAAAIADLVTRQLARRSIGAPFGAPEWAIGWDVVAAGLAGVILVRGSKRSSRTRTCALFSALFAVGVAAQLTLGARLQSDGFYYFAYTRSIWFDADVNLANDYRLLGLDPQRLAHLFVPTETGYAQTTWAIGPALLWSPFFGLGHLVALALAPVDPRVAADGTSFPYRQAVCLAGLFYGLAGIFLCHRFACAWFPAAVAAAAATAAALGSFVVWYLVREPTMSHAVSLAAVALVCYGWSRLHNSLDVRGWALLGLAGGVMMTVRWQNAIVLLLPALSWLRLTMAADTVQWRRAVACVLAFIAAAVLGSLPQLYAWNAIYGHWVARSDIAPAMYWWQPQIVDVLWSSRNGLFATSPALYLGAAGLVVFWRRDRRVSAAALVIFVLMTWTNASVDDWYGGAGFGGRRFDSLIPFLTCGLAAMVSVAATLARRFPGLAASALLFMLLPWTATLVTVAHDGVYRPGQAVSFGRVGAAQAATLHDWIGHPFSYPVSLWWAWRNDLPPGTFDKLRPNRFLSDPRRQYGRIDLGGADGDSLGDGWLGAGTAGATSFRWASPRSELLVPLDHVADLVVQIRLRACEAAAASTPSMSLIVNGTTVATSPLECGWQVVERPVSRVHWRRGVNRVVLSFGDGGRVEAGDTESRGPGVAVDFVRVTVTAAE
jgi:hypothetical protein